MSLAMSRAEREAFLAATHVAVVSIARPGPGPLAVPVWYRYEPGGDVRFVTGGRSKKAELVRRSGRLSLLVQSETPPYRYVSVEGPAAVHDHPDFESDVRSVARRYLGEQMAEMYLAATAAEREGSVVVVVEPEHWLSVDYHKMAGGA
jgi:PPOX class probable F420-dependent enzyme